MKFSTSSVAMAVIWILASGLNDHQVHAENSTGNSDRRRRGTSVRGLGREDTSQRQLTPVSCIDDDYVCEWNSELKSSENKYAICVKDTAGNFESKCVDAKQAKPGIEGSDTITCGCCKADTPSGKGGFKDCPSVLEANEPNTCKAAAFTCRSQSGKGKGSTTTGVSYCAKVEIGKGSTPTFGISDECGDPFDDIKEEKGEEFLNCGVCPSAMPSLAPSSSPSDAPSLGCEACPTNQAKYVVNTNLLSWEDHNTFASTVGCVLASITSEAEQAAALAAIDANSPVSVVPFVWFGARPLNAGDNTVWTWIDDSGNFPGDGMKMATPPYRNWNSAQPNASGAQGGLYFQPVSPFARGDWDNGSGKYGALYKCCNVQPDATDFQVCPLA